MAYFANGTEGMVLDCQCADCPYGQDPCPIYLMQAEFNYEACNDKLGRRIMASLVNEDGICQMHALVKSKDRP